VTLKGYQLSFFPDVQPYWLENPTVGDVLSTTSGEAIVTRTELLDGGECIAWADYGSGVEHPHAPEYRPTLKVGDRLQVKQWLYGEHVWADAIITTDPDGLVADWIATTSQGHTVTGRTVVNKWFLRNCRPHFLKDEGRRMKAEGERQKDEGKRQNPFSSFILHPSALASPSRRRRYPGKGKASGWIEERKGNRKRKNPSISHYYRWEDTGGKHSKYIQVRKVARVQQMIGAGCPVGEILEVLE